MTRDQRASRVSMWLLLAICSAAAAFRFAEEALIPLLIVAAFGVRQAVELMLPPEPDPAVEDFGQHEPEAGR